MTVHLMSRRLTIVAVAVAVTAILALALWIFAGAISGGRGDAARDVSGSHTSSAAPVAQAVEIGPGGLAIPVAGVKASQLVDSDAQARFGGERHDALDIMAPAGTPVVAAAPGQVEKLYDSAGADGITVYIRSDDGRWLYSYAHLQGYAPGLKDGQWVGRGQMIGRVGSTGSASPRGPHLHFQIRRIGREEPRSRGTPVNPYPLLTGRGG